MIQEQLFPSARSAGATNRAMVVGIGSFGARCLAHLWPRISFEDEQRRILYQGLPRLSSLVSYALLLPFWDNAQNYGEIVAGQPDPGTWMDSHFTRSVSRETTVDWFAIQKPGHESSPAELTYNSTLRSSLQNKGCEPVRVPGFTRAEYFKALLASEELMGDFFLQAVGKARIDQDAPGQEVERFSVYLVAAAYEPPASALLWPAVNILRSYLEPFLNLEITALLSIGAYGEGRQRQMQGASAFTTLLELEQFSPPGAKPGWLELTERQKSPHSFLDYIYLLDSEKRNHTLPYDELEPLTAIGNALEIMLTSDAPDRIAGLVGPDSEHVLQAAPFSSLGTASIYIPVNEWNDRNQSKYILEVLEEEFLRVAPRPLHDERSRQSEHLSLEHLVRQMIRNQPLTLRRQSSPQMRRLSLGQRLRDLTRPRGERLAVIGDVGQLLSQAGSLHSLSGGPDLPLPEVTVRPGELRPRYMDYQDPDHPRRLPPEEWFQALVRHYQAWDIDCNAVIAGSAEPAPAQEEAPQDQPNRLQALSEGMLAACNLASDPRLTQAAQQGLAELVGQQAGSGIVPDFYRLLLHRVCHHLQRDNQGMHIAHALVKNWLKQIETAVRQVADYRLRLERAFHGPAMAEFYDRSAAHMVAFQRSLGNRPHLSALAARGLGLASFTALLIRYAALRWNPTLDPHLILYLPLAGGVCLALAVGIWLWSHYYHRIRQSFGWLENDFGRLLNLIVNIEVARMMVGDDARSGLLPDLQQVLQAFNGALNENLEQLQKEAEYLRQDLSTPIGQSKPYLRQPFPGLEDIERKLQEQTRSDDWQRDLGKLIPSAAAMHALHLEPAVEWAVERAGGPLPRSPRPKYVSISDYLLKIIRDYASPKRILPPPDLKISYLLHSRFPTYTPSAFLSDLRSRTQFFINWDDARNTPSLPVAYELLVQEEPLESPDFLEAAHSLGLLPLANLDPYAITTLRLVFGISSKSIPHLQRYAEDFNSLTNQEQRELALEISEAVLGSDGSYLGKRVRDFTVMSEADHV